MESMREGGCPSQVKRAGKFFNKLAPSSLEDFSEMEYPSSYAANVVLFNEGEPERALFVVLEGEERLSINSSEGRRLNLRIARAGDIIGRSSTLSGIPYDMAAETLCPSKIAAIERVEFLEFLARYPDAYQSVLDELGSPPSGFSRFHSDNPESRSLGKLRACEVCHEQMHHKLKRIAHIDRIQPSGTSKPWTFAETARWGTRKSGDKVGFRASSRAYHYFQWFTVSRSTPPHLHPPTQDVAQGAFERSLNSGPK
jgi:Cyclic nucleotide-binding domain